MTMDQPILTKKDVLAVLAEGARNEVARAGDVAAAAISHPELIPHLIEALGNADAAIVSHAAQALLKLARLDIGCLLPYRAALITAFELEQWEIQEQVAKILPLLELDTAALARVMTRIDTIFLTSESSIARTCAMQAAVDLAQKHPTLRRDAGLMLTVALTSGSKAMQARARQLVHHLPKA